MSNPTKNRRTRERNLARKLYRKQYPQHRGKKLHYWPLPESDLMTGNWSAAI